MKSLKIFIMLLFMHYNIYANPTQFNQFCAGFKQGFSSIGGNLEIPPLCPIAPIPPIGISFFQIGITEGIRAAGGFQNNNSSQPIINSTYAVSDETIGETSKPIRGFRNRIDYLWPAIQNGRINSLPVRIEFSPPTKKELPQFVADNLEANEQWMRETDNGKKIYLVIFNPTNTTITNVGLNLYEDDKCGRDGAPIYASIYLELSSPLYPTKIAAYTFRPASDENTFGYSNSCIIISRVW